MSRRRRYPRGRAGILSTLFLNPIRSAIRKEVTRPFQRRVESKTRAVLVGIKQSFRPAGYVEIPMERGLEEDRKYFMKKRRRRMI